MNLLSGVKHMMIKPDQLKTSLSIVRERIAIAKRQATHSGFIDYRGCLSVCHEFVQYWMTQVKPLQAATGLMPIL